MLAASLPSHSLRSNKRISVSVPSVKTNSGVRAFHSFLTLLVGSSQCLVSPLNYIDHFKIVVRLCLDWWTLILISWRILVISVYPTIQVLLLSMLFILATALAYRDPGFCINCPSRAVVCYHKDSFVISRVLSPSLERILCLYLSANRRMRLPPRLKLNLVCPWSCCLEVMLAWILTLLQQAFASEQSMLAQWEIRPQPYPTLWSARASTF